MPKSKAPAFQFYVADYIQDTRMLSLDARGAWVECLCQMWIAPERGKIEYSVEEFARLFGCGNVQAEKVIFELMDSGICDALPKRYQDVTRYDQKITIMSRRMLRDEKMRKSNSDKQKRYRGKNITEPLPESNPDNNHDVTSPSTDYSLQTTSTTIKEGSIIRQVDDIVKKYPRHVGMKKSCFIVLEIFETGTITARQLYDKVCAYANMLERYEINEDHELWNMVPSPTTWFSESRWELSEAEWSAPFRDGKYTKPADKSGHAPHKAPFEWMMILVDLYQDSDFQGTWDMLYDQNKEIYFDVLDEVERRKDSTK